MARIYLDSNVYSNLRRSEQQKYIALEEAITKYSDSFLFVFSHAHIRDKINDTSDLKFKDFEYMQKFVVDNYLSYHALNENTSFYLASPLEVFKDNDALEDINFAMEMMGSYKALRALIEEAKGFIQIGSKIFNRSELYKDGEIGENFVDLVKTSLYPDGESQIPYYEFYLQSYALLDMLGFSRDKLNKKNSFNNIFNDSLHSYYARYCDYLITEDGGLQTKSSILYENYKVATQIMSVEEFLEKVELIAYGTENNLLDFFNQLANDLSNSKIIGKYSENDEAVFDIIPARKYFNFFDLLQVMKTREQGIYIFLSKLETNYLSGANFREKQRIINKMLQLFGNDLYRGTPFDFELEVQEIRTGSWKGRYWEVGETQIAAKLNSNQKISVYSLDLSLAGFIRLGSMESILNRVTT